MTPAYIATSIEMRDGNQELLEYRKNDDEISVVDNRKEPDPVNHSAELAQLKRKFEFSILK